MNELGVLPRPPSCRRRPPISASLKPRIRGLFLNIEVNRSPQHGLCLSIKGRSRTGAELGHVAYVAECGVGRSRGDIGENSEYSAGEWYIR
jgi:hypothetical protein